MITFGENIIINVPKKEERSVGGILLLANTRDGHDICEVIAVGEGRVDHDGTITPLTVKKGDRVLVTAGTGLALDGTLVLIKEADIVGIVTEE